VNSQYDTKLRAARQSWRWRVEEKARVQEIGRERSDEIAR